jgi:hypothetical protein
MDHGYNWLVVSSAPWTIHHALEKALKQLAKCRYGGQVYIEMDDEPAILCFFTLPHILLGAVRDPWS